MSASCYFQIFFSAPWYIFSFTGSVHFITARQNDSPITNLSIGTFSENLNWIRFVTDKIHIAGFCCKLDNVLVLYIIIFRFWNAGGKIKHSEHNCMKRSANSICCKSWNNFCCGTAVTKYTKQTNSVSSLRERTISTERPLLVGEVSTNFCG
jgi:hypothetical protein